MCQISSLVAATEGAVAEFSSFANFEERNRKSNLFMSFPKIVHQKGSFGQIRKNLLFRFCRPILNIFGLTLLSTEGGKDRSNGTHIRVIISSEPEISTKIFRNLGEKLKPKLRVGTCGYPMVKFSHLNDAFSVVVQLLGFN